MDWVIAFLIIYEAGYTKNVLTEQTYPSSYECMKEALSEEYRQSIKQYYGGKGVSMVRIYCTQPMRHQMGYEIDT